MTKTIFEKLIERIEKRKFDLVEADCLGHKIRMDGFLLNKTEWEQYPKPPPDAFLRGYTDKKVKWFRGYPVKQKND